MARRVLTQAIMATIKRGAYKSDIQPHMLVLSLFSVATAWQLSFNGPAQEFLPQGKYCLIDDWFLLRDDHSELAHSADYAYDDMLTALLEEHRAVRNATAGGESKTVADVMFSGIFGWFYSV